MTAIVSPSAIAEYICFFIRNNLVTDGIEVTPATPLEQLGLDSKKKRLSLNGKQQEKNTTNKIKKKKNND